MATVEEQLVGFQVVRALNQVQASMLDLAGKLKAAKDDLEAGKLKEESTRTLDHLEAKLGNVAAFLSKYPGGASGLAKSYQAMGVTPKQVKDEMANLVSVRGSAKQALDAAGTGKDDVVSAGNGLHDGVEGHITEIMDVELHFEPIQMHVACWDLVNVMAITLKGLSHGTGKPLAGDSVEKRKKSVLMHLKTFSRAEKYLDDTEEAIDLQMAVDTVGSVIHTATTTGQLSALGDSVDAAVPRAPLLRRVWQYD